MNRMMTALALSGLFVAAPAFAKVSHQGRKPAPVADKTAVGDKATGEKAAGDKGEMKSETSKTETSTGTEGSKPAKRSKHKKAEKTTEGAAGEKPAEAPAK